MATETNEFCELKQALNQLEYPNSYYSYLTNNGIDTIETLNVLIDTKQTQYLNAISFGHYLMIQNTVTQIIPKETEFDTEMAEMSNTTNTFQNVLNSIQKYQKMYSEKLEFITIKHTSVKETANGNKTEMTQNILELRQIGTIINTINDLLRNSNINIISKTK